jgi:hypothetical protein
MAVIYPSMKAQSAVETLLPTLEEIKEAQRVVYSVISPTPQIQWPLLGQP